MIDICRLFKFKICKKEKERKASSTRFDSEKHYKLFNIHGIRKELNFEYLQSGCLKKGL